MTFHWILGCALVCLQYVATAAGLSAYDQQLPVTHVTCAEIPNDSADSIRITTMLEAVQTLPAGKDKLLFLAKGFQGTPYKAGTLETFPFEHLVVHTSEVDCTTFVEYVLALYRTHLILDARRHENRSTSLDVLLHRQLLYTKGLPPYTIFKQLLQYIRYRSGKLQGYTSRLHYFSEWIVDNERKLLIREVTKESPYAVRKVDLNFMSQHASLYPFLANDSTAVSQMKNIESLWMGFQQPYIPKEKLNQGKDILKIKDGDILTLVTNIKGLDVVHVGFACWIQDQLHLLHASSAKKHVLLDPVPLYQYSKNKKTHIGIRAIRVLR